MAVVGKGSVCWLLRSWCALKRSWLATSRVGCGRKSKAANPGLYTNINLGRTLRVRVTSARSSIKSRDNARLRIFSRRPPAVCLSISIQSPPESPIICANQNMLQYSMHAQPSSISKLASSCKTSRSIAISFLICVMMSTRAWTRRRRRHLTLPMLLGEMSRAMAKCCAARTSSPISRYNFASWKTTLDSSGARSRRRTRSFSASCKPRQHSRRAPTQSRAAKRTSYRRNPIRIFARRYKTRALSGQI